jgi:isoquinoline 1-oxidoreductase alpha subunit
MIGAAFARRYRCIRPSYLREATWHPFKSTARRSVSMGREDAAAWYLRDELGLLGTKFGCGMALCGACTIHLDGVAVRSCVTPVSEAEGKHITTIEGLDPEGNHPLQQAWRAHNVPQCRYCQSGQIMQAAALLAEKPNPTDDDIDAAMSGNICRCGTYTPDTRRDQGCGPLGGHK